MQKSLALLLVVALLVAGLFAALWLTLKRPDSGTSVRGAEATSADATTAADGALDEPRAGHELAGGAALVSGERSTAATADDVVDPDTARHIAGRVVFPAGMERDDTLTVIAIGHEWTIEESSETDAPGRPATGDGAPASAPGATREELLPRDATSARDDRLNDGFSRGTAAVGADGRFEVLVAARCNGAHLYLDGKHLFLREPVGVGLGDAAAQALLEPLLGARILGRASVPSRPSEEKDLVGSSVNLSISGDDDDFSFMRFSGFGGREARIDDDLGFEFRGLDPAAQHVLACAPDAFLPVMRPEIVLHAGQDTEILLEHDLGARVSGRVVDGTGAPVEGARISRERGPFGAGMMFGGSGDKRTQSAADGSFTLRGLRPGKTVVAAQKGGLLKAQSTERALVEGEVLSGIELVLASGLTLGGRVTWPDGTPAGNARVELTGLATEQGRPWERSTFNERCDADGRFAISGLEDEPFELVASSLAAGEEREDEFARLDAETSRALDSSERGAAVMQRMRAGNELQKGPRWTARRDDVRPGGAELLLTLEEPLAVEGRVEDDLGAPLASFSISASPVLAEESWWDRSTSTKETFEDPGGRFELGGLQPGRYRLTPTAARHAVQAEAREIDVPYTGEPLVLVLPRAARVMGSVIDPGGAPVADATVSSGESGMTVFGRGRQRSSASTTTTTTTDAEGRFVLDLPAAEASLTASAEGWARSAPLPLELVPAGELENVVLQLGLGGTLTGEVYRPDGSAQSGAKVMANSMGGDSGANARADDAGRFTIEHVTPGTYQVMVEPDPAAMTSMMEGEGGDFGKVFEALKMTSAQIVEGETTHVVLGAPPKAPVRIVGRVTDGDAPVAGRMIVAMAEGKAMLSSMKMAQTDDDGRFELELREPGPVLFTLQQEGSNGGPQWFEDIPEVERHEVRFELPGGRLGGRVVGPDGRALAGVAVRMGREGGEAFTMMAFNDRVTSGADGRFAFKSLEPGEYSLRAGGGGAFGGEASYGTALVTGIRLADGEQRENLTIRLDAACEIRGRVVDSEGRPAADATVFVRDADGRLVDSFSATQTDTGGRFAYRGIAPGDYTVSARGASEACADGARIAVHSGEASQVELALEPATMVLVTIESAEGVASRARVRVLDDEGREYAAMTTPAAMQAAFTQGFSTREHRIGPVPAGSYTVIATTFDGVEKKKPITLRGQAERRVTLELE